MLDVDSAIRGRAYEIWQAEGEMPGRDLDYWLRAEAEIKGAFTPAAKPPRPAPKRPAKAKAKAKA